MELVDPTETLNAARVAAEAAKAAALARLDALEGERAEYLKGYAAEKARIKEALRTRPFQAKPRKPKPVQAVQASPPKPLGAYAPKPPLATGIEAKEQA